MLIKQEHTRCQLQDCGDSEAHCLVCGRPYPCPDVVGDWNRYQQGYNIPWLLVPVEQANAADWATADNRRQMAAGA